MVQEISEVLCINTEEIQDRMNELRQVIILACCTRP